jgi:hypothetical protein
MRSVMVVGGGSFIPSRKWAEARDGDLWRVPPLPMNSMNRRLELDEYKRYGRQMILDGFGLDSKCAGSDD